MDEALSAIAKGLALDCSTSESASLKDDLMLLRKLKSQLEVALLPKSVQACVVDSLVKKENVRVNIANLLVAGALLLVCRMSSKLH